MRQLWGREKWQTIMDFVEVEPGHPYVYARHWQLSGMEPEPLYWQARDQSSMPLAAFGNIQSEIVCGGGEE